MHIYINIKLLLNIIFKVQDWEVCVSPYISPSHRKFITAEKLEIERRRLAMLADDFRDRALDIMMYFLFFFSYK